MKHFLHAGAAVLLVWGLRAEAQFVDPSLRWRTLDTAHFSVHFAEHYRAQAQVVAEIAETGSARRNAPRSARCRACASAARDPRTAPPPSSPTRAEPPPRRP